MHDFVFTVSERAPGGGRATGGRRGRIRQCDIRLCRHTPETGKKVLFVNALFTTHIEGLPPLESAEVPQFQRHASPPGSPAALAYRQSVLDNRSTQHKPVNDFFPPHAGCTVSSARAINPADRSGCRRCIDPPRLTMGAKRYSIRIGW